MRTLTNSYQDCELLNLSYNKDGRGPYLLRQDGCPPDSVTPHEYRFLLRKDLTWVLNLIVFALPEKELENFIYKDAAELYAAVEELGGKPVVEDALPPGKSHAELSAAIEITASKLWSRIRDARATRLMKGGI
jgi:hypothetical protein